jgi:hypothetical protein
MTPEECPHCGAEVPDGAKVCPACGSCAETGWSEAARSDALGLPDDSFDYQEFVQTEFGPPAVQPRGVRWYWWLVAIGLALAMLLAFGL